MEKMNTAERRQIYEKHAVQAEHALAVLQKYVPEKTSMFSSLEGKPLMRKSELDKIRSERKRLLTTADDLMNLSKRISENAANVAKLENQIESLIPWMSLDILFFDEFFLLPLYAALGVIYMSECNTKNKLLADTSLY